MYHEENPGGKSKHLYRPIHVVNWVRQLKELFPFILRFLFMICAWENGKIYDIDSCRDYSEVSN
jgi:hypothetical protein